MWDAPTIPTAPARSGRAVRLVLSLVIAATFGCGIGMTAVALGADDDRADAAATPTTSETDPSEPDPAATAGSHPPTVPETLNATAGPESQGGSPAGSTPSADTDATNADATAADATAADASTTGATTGDDQSMLPGDGMDMATVGLGYRNIDGPAGGGPRAGTWIGAQVMIESAGDSDGRLGSTAPAPMLAIAGAWWSGDDVVHAAVWIEPTGTELGPVEDPFGRPGYVTSIAATDAGFIVAGSVRRPDGTMASMVARREHDGRWSEVWLPSTGNHVTADAVVARGRDVTIMGSTTIAGIASPATWVSSDGGVTFAVRECHPLDGLNGKRGTAPLTGSDWAGAGTAGAGTSRGTPTSSVGPACGNPEGDRDS